MERMTVFLPCIKSLCTLKFYMNIQSISKPTSLQQFATVVALLEAMDLQWEMVGFV